MSDRLKLALDQVSRLSEAEQDAFAEILMQHLARVRAGEVVLTEEMLLSESTLAKDWLRPEEDRAWANL